MEKDFWQVGHRCRRFVVVERGISGEVAVARGMGKDLGTCMIYICVNPGRPFTDLCT